MRGHRATQARSFALRTLGLRAISSEEGLTTLLVRIFTVALWSQVQMGCRGGQMQSWASRRMKALTTVSSENGMR